MNTVRPQAADEQLKLLVSSVVDYAIFMLDTPGTIITWNEGAQRIKGYSVDEIIGRHFSIFYSADEVRIRKPEWELEGAKREGRYEEEGWRFRKDGTRFWANVVITALRNESGRLQGFGKVTRDLTDRRLREQQKTQCLKLASHELRGLVTAIRGYNSMLEDGSIPIEQIPGIAQLVETKLAQMDSLVEQMLETARLGDMAVESTPARAASSR